MSMERRRITDLIQKTSASVPGKTILGNNTQGNYKIRMTGQTKDGQTLNKDATLSLMKSGRCKAGRIAI